jgi:large subunit ribosomal protein L21
VGEFRTLKKTVTLASVPNPALPKQSASMYAIVDVKDKQFKVRENDTLYVPYHSEADVDDTLTFDRVLLLSDGDGEVTIGTPTVEDASVSARVVDQVKGDKVIVFKKKRRKRYRVKRGHRQQYTKIEIESLHANGAAPVADEAGDEAGDAERADEPSASADAPTDEASADEASADEASDVEASASNAAEADAADAAGDAEADDEAETDDEGDGSEDDDEADDDEADDDKA